MDTPIDMLQVKIEKAREALPRETRHAIDSVDWRAIILGMREKKGYSFEQLEDLELETELLLCGLLNPTDYSKELEERLKIPRSQVDLLVNEMNEFIFKKIKDELIKNSQRAEVFVKKESFDNANIIETDRHVNSPNIINIKPPMGSTPNVVGTTEPIKVKENIKESPVLSNKTDIEIMPEELIGKVIKTDINTTSTSLENKQNNEATIVVPRNEEQIKEPPSKTPTKTVLEQKLSGSYKKESTTTEYSLDNLSKEGKNTGSILNSINNKTKISKADPYRLDPNE